MFKRKPESDLWGGAFARLVRIAYPWTTNEADAQEIAQEALADVFAKSPEPPRDIPELVRCAASVMKGHFLNRRRAEEKRQDPRWVASAAERSPVLRRTPENLVAEKAHKTRLLTRLLEDLKEDPLATQIVQATLEACDTAAEQAEYLGKDIREIRNARKRVTRAVDAIAAKEGDTQPERDWQADQVASLAEDELEGT